MGETLWLVVQNDEPYEKVLIARRRNYYAAHSLEDLKRCQPKYFWGALTAIVRDLQWNLDFISATGSLPPR